MSELRTSDLQEVMKWSPARLNRTFGLDPRKPYAVLPEPVSTWTAVIRRNHHRYFTCFEFLHDFELAMIEDDATRFGSMCYAMQQGPREVMLWRKQYNRFQRYRGSFHEAMERWEAVSGKLGTDLLHRATGVPKTDWVARRGPAAWLLSLVDGIPKLRVDLLPLLLGDGRWRLGDPGRIDRTFRICFTYYFNAIKEPTWAPN